MPGRICPSCRNNVDALPEPEPQAQRVVEAAYGYAAGQIQSGVAPSGVARKLTDRGLDPASATAVVNDLERSRALALREEGQKNMLYGALCCFGGIAVTSWSLQVAAGAGGGSSVIACGAILFGGIQFVRGLVQSARS